MFRPNDVFFLKAFVCLAGTLGICGWAGVDASEALVSQRGRKFDPPSIDIAKGGTLTIVNDDGDLLHHAYIESDDFNFDSGDQKPGSRTRIVFTVAGDFKILCGIHPKMRMVVHVR